MKNTKKRSKTQWLVMIGYMLIGAACGVLVMKHLDHLGESAFTPSAKLIRLLLLVLCMYGALTLQLIIHEAGHLVFGLATGYRFSSFRVFNLMLLKEDGKLRFKKLSLAGTGGQCLMSPPDLHNGRMPVLLYNFGGALLNLISSLLFAAAMLLCPPWSFGWTVLCFLVIIGIAFALINGLPFGTGTVNNDGRNALDLIRSPEAMRAFWIQMKVNELTARGSRLKDMPEEWFEMPSEEAMQNGIIATIGVLRCNRLMDEKRFQEADQQMARILAKENGVVGLYRFLLTCDRMYVELIGPNRPESVQGMRTKAHQKMVKAMKRFPAVLRTEYAYALLHEQDQEKADAIRQQFEKIANTYPYPSEIRGERELMDLAANTSSSRRSNAHT